MSDHGEGPCPVCGVLSKTFRGGTGHASQVSCPRCGDYLISDTCVAILGTPRAKDSLLNTDEKRASVGHWLHEQRKGGVIPHLKSEVVERMAKDPWFPSLQDQRENLLRWLGAQARAPGASVDVDRKSIQYLIGARAPQSVDTLLYHLSDQKLAILTRRPAGHDAQFGVALTFDGWLAYEDIKRGKTSGKSVFLATPFNKPDLDTQWFPKLKEAVRETGFTLKRVDDEPKPGLIDDRMRLQIKQARFLIVELTHANLGAYWEAGFAEGLGKPVIYTLRQGEVAHFDVDHSLRIEWNPAKIDDALARIKATIRNALPDAAPEPEV